MAIPEIPDASEDDYDDTEYRKPECTICGSDDECEHIVFLYDRTFMECKAGHCEQLYRLETLISDTFQAWIDNDATVNFSDGQDAQYLSEIWSYAKANYTKEDPDIEFDYVAFMELVREIIEFSLTDCTSSKQFAQV